MALVLFLVVTFYYHSGPGRRNSFSHPITALSALLIEISRAHRIANKKPADSHRHGSFFVAPTTLRGPTLRPQGCVRLSWNRRERGRWKALHIV